MSCVTFFDNSKNRTSDLSSNHEINTRITGRTFVTMSHPHLTNKDVRVDAYWIRLF